MPVSKKTPALVARARAMFDDGADLNAIAAELGLVRNTVGDWLKTTGLTGAEVYGRSRKGLAAGPPVPVVNHVPDTRSLSARLCGEPTPGRSALDMRSPRHAG